MSTPIIIKVIFNLNFFKKLFSFISLCLIIYFLRSFLLFFLAIFLFSYLFGHLWEYVEDKINKFLFKFKNQTANKIADFISFRLVITVIYIIFISLIIFLISRLIPWLLQELWNITNLVEKTTFINNNQDIKSLINWLKDIINWLKDINDLNSNINNIDLNDIFSQKNYDVVTQNSGTISIVYEKIKNFWSFILQFVLAILISYIIILDKKHSLKFLKNVKNSNFDFFYREFKNIFWKIKKWFWLIFKAQSLIAVINTIITIAWYYIIGYFYWWFHYLLSMAIIVFLCSFIPILWMWISAIPLCFIAWNIWWINAALMVLWLIILVHLIEAYILNPKIVSSYLELPISITFIVLILSEHFFWMIWFLIWMPLFYILIDLSKDLDSYVDKVRRKHKELKNIAKS